MRPVIIVTVNGQVMSAPFYSRLVSAECNDQEGVKSDTCRLVLNDGPEAGYLAIPQHGSIITVSLGYGSATLVGRYTLDVVSIRALPYQMELSGKSADLRKEMKANKARHWDEKTVEDIVSEIAGEHGLSPQVSGAVSSLKYDWIGQLDEGDIHFLERLARRTNAVFTIKNGRLIFAEKGSGLTAGGSALSSYVITPDRIVENSCQVRFADRSQYKDVVAYYQDRGELKRKELRVQSNPDGVATHTLPEPYASEDEAEKAADSKSKALQRAMDRLTVAVVGDPAIAAGMPVTLANVRPGVDGRPWIIKTAKHKYDKGGYFTEIEAEAQV